MSLPEDPSLTDRVSFCVGTGRCGTTFITKVIAEEPEVAAAHERQRLGATFHMFCKWNDIPVDSAGFLEARRKLIQQDLKDHHYSFESSALLSHSIEELHAAFGARFVLLVRDPAATVASFAVRGWFVRVPPRYDPSLPPSYFGGEKSRHFLGRNLPRGEEYHRWANLTQIGRIAWFWAARNSAILQQFRKLPSSSTQIVRLEDLNFSGYQQLAQSLGWKSQITAERFQALADARWNAGPNEPRTMDQWSDQEVTEFNHEVDVLAQSLGYPCTK